LTPVKATDQDKSSGARWLNRTVLGVGLASLFSDWSHETATSVMPAFLAAIGASAAWLGLIEGISDGLSSFAKMGSGYFTDKLQRRKPIAVAGYVVTALGTAAFGLATTAWQVLLARSTAWLGRGVRTPVRKALMAAAVDRSTYGRAFGFERTMDTIGAIAGPATGFFLLRAFHQHYPSLFAATLVPGLLAAAVMAFLVQERERKPVKHISFGERLRILPAAYKKFLLAVSLFGAGGFAHTMLILLATQWLTPQMGPAKAASAAVALYILHNIFYAAFNYIGGWTADRFAKKWLLAIGFLIGAVMTACIIFARASLASLSVIFILAGVSVALEETVEDSFCAELVTEEHQGMAFGVLATVNGIGDFISSIVVGLLWTTCGASVAFGYSGVLFVLGAWSVTQIRAE
jgi:MFS family permease